ncbi:MAG TPA: LysR family transcriptional regulator [Candidatus Obscuribacterales bacterium]
MKSINLAAVDLNLLVAFEAIYEERSVTAAARRLHLGQPAMSAALGRLRSLLDDDLFIRVGRDMQPTVKAQALAPEITTALHYIRQTLASSQTFDPATAQRTLAIAGSDYASGVILPKLLAYCQHHAPQIDLRLISLEKTEVESLLAQQTIAIALGTFQTLPRQTHQVPLMTECFVGICRQGHPLLAALPLTLEAFAALPQALFTLRRDATGEVDATLAQRGLQRRIALTTPYLLTLPPLIAASDLVAVVPSRMAQPLTEAGAIAQFPLPLDLAPWAIAMIWHQLSDRDPACRWLRDAIQRVCHELSPLPPD